MTRKEAKIKALWKIWHWAFHMYEGYPDEFSDTLNSDIYMEFITEEDARMLQKELWMEGQRIRKRIERLKENGRNTRHGEFKK